MDSTSSLSPSRNDEISLRDVYLIFRRGLPLILITALLAGAVVFIISSFLPKVYEAETTVLISPPAVSVEGVSSLSFRPPSEVSFEAYETLAGSKGILGEAAQNIDPELSYTDINGSVEELIGPQGSGQPAPLLVTHRVQDNDPERAIQLADAWATATLFAVQRSLFANLEPINTITGETIEPLREALSEAEKALEGFESTDRSRALEANLSNLSQLIALAKSGIVTTGQFSLAQTGEVPLNPSNPITLENTLNADTRFNLEQEITAREAYLETMGGGTDEDRANLEALRARQTLLAEQLAEYETSYDEARRELATLERQRRELELALENAESDYQSVIRLQPMIDYVSKLSPTNARILNSASTTVASEPAPVGPNRTLNTALAVVGVGLVMLVFVFLREAIRQ
ncbi:MAG: Wzz/FepE/Etk N-terminal domain-containing protein [Trueperaceae bacterium]